MKQYSQNLRLSHRACCFVILLWGLLGMTACGGVDHDDLDTWRQTEKGPDKLMKAFQDDSLDSELRAHAAQNLVHLDKEAEVKDVIERLGSESRDALISELAPRLWSDARIDGEMSVPNPKQHLAKDVLYALRTFANESDREQIDRYLVDWFTDGYYEGRATSGRISGAEVMRVVGFKGAPKLLESVKTLATKAPDEKGQRLRIGDETLLGLAYTGDEQALSYLLSLSTQKNGDESLPERAMSAIYKAYVEPAGLKPADGRYLVAIREQLVAITENENLSGTSINDAYDLLSTMGLPECLPPFVKMIAKPRRIEPYRWIGTQRGIRCGGVKAIAPVLEALPANEEFERAILDKYVWTEILKIPEKGLVAKEALRLLDSDNWVAQASAVELLRILSHQASASESVKKNQTVIEE